MLRALAGAHCLPRVLQSSGTGKGGRPDLMLRHQGGVRASPSSYALGLGTSSTGLAERGSNMETVMGSGCVGSRGFGKVWWGAESGRVWSWVGVRSSGL